MKFFEKLNNKINLIYMDLFVKSPEINIKVNIETLEEEIERREDSLDILMSRMMTIQEFFGSNIVGNLSSEDSVGLLHELMEIRSLIIVESNKIVKLEEQLEEQLDNEKKERKISSKGNIVHI